MFGAIEAGGTKFVCAVGEKDGKIIDLIEIPTTQPNETLERVFEFFDGYVFESMGVGSFGPIGVKQSSKEYGYILETPKKGWENFNFLGEINNRYKVPCAWTTDVNAAAFAEFKKGAAKGTDSCIYLTIGTGIGGGVVLNGEVLQDLNHPEMGHISVKRHLADDYQGCCPYHQDCLEGLASGPSLEARTGERGEFISENSRVWEYQAYYIAQALVTYSLVLSPERIILGGGVMKQAHMLPRIQENFEKLMNGYVKTPELTDYIVPWSMPGKTGIIGALLLAEKELER